MTVDARGRPAGSLEPFHLVDGIGKRQRAIDGDAVVVEQHNKFVEFQVACERDGFLADPFHEVAIGSQHISVVIDDLAAENRRHMPLGYRHADRVGDPLAERTVVVSTPGVWPCSGWPGVSEPIWRKCSSSPTV